MRNSFARAFLGGLLVLPVWSGEASALAQGGRPTDPGPTERRLDALIRAYEENSNALRAAIVYGGPCQLDDYRRRLALLLDSQRQFSAFAAATTSLADFTLNTQATALAVGAGQLHGYYLSQLRNCEERAPATMITPARYQRLREEFDQIMLQLRAAERDADGLCQLRALQLRVGALRALERAARDYARTAPEGGQPSAAELNQLADRAREAADYYERALLQDCTERSLADEAGALNSRHESAARECDPEAMAALLAEIEEVEQQAERIQRTGRSISAEAARAQLRRVRAILAEARAREAQNCPTEDSAASPTGAPEGPVTADEAAQADAAEPSPSASAFDRVLPPIGEPPAELCINYNFDEDVDCEPIFDLEGGIGETQMPVTGIGFRRAGAPGAAPETFAVTTPRSTDIVFIQGRIHLPFGRIAPIVTFGYAEGDVRRDFAIPAGGGVDSGVVYGDNAPSGSSGIATPFGLSGGAAVDQAAIEVGVEVPLLMQGDRPSNPRSTTAVDRPASLVVTAQGTFQRSDTDYQGDAAFSGSGLSFSQTRSQEVDETRIGAGLGATFFLPLADDVAVRLSASGLVYHRDTELTSSERNLCSFCPAADRDFRIDIDESDKGWGFQADVEAAVEFWLSPRLALSFGGRADYLSSVGGVFNPNSGDQVFFDGRRTGLLTDSVWSWRIGAGARIAFGGR